MQPTYQTEGGTFVQYTVTDKEQVPEGNELVAIMLLLAEWKSIYPKVL